MEETLVLDKGGMVEHISICYVITVITCVVIINILYLAFLQKKHAENGYFNQWLECAAPKRWSKYTTHVTFGHSLKINWTKRPDS